MLWGLILLIAVIAILRSIQLLWSSYSDSKRFFSLYNLTALFLIYTTVLIAFGLSYVVLEEIGFTVLREDDERLTVHSFQLVEICLYFSAVTLLSVGYGDITPIGIGRWIAIVEALIGYTLPFAFVVRTVIDNEK
ncbi:two pore domain potassium channel family protein [Bacillus clarus]|uniref:Ion channel family protein n=1 Tax=Bacillus clarus TaxID=2338372 RepID=A0A090YRU9_9BACI|nr:potassium channel family protein [Bacillus clarus]KFN01130.1 ion channel family protein [Bacillus clarus]RFT65840.1 two pore domain potassium channel family protein [Bacillus clarus]